MASPALVLSRVERVTLNSLAYEGLKGALLSGRLEPGAVLTLRQLAEELGTSMMPVREAVSRLAAENALAVQPNRGIVVPQLDAESATDIWNLRINLEGEASARAATHATATEIEQIRARCAEVESAARDADLHRLLERNNAFQFAIYQAARSPVLLRLIEILRMQSVPHCTAAVRVMVSERPPYFSRSWSNHAAIVTAIEHRDGEAAQRIKQMDLREFRDFVTSLQNVQT